MSGLRECLRRLGLDEHEAAILRGMAKDNREDGMDARAAAAAAIREAADDAHAERSSIAAQIKQQTGIDVGEAKRLPEAKLESAPAPAAEKAAEPKAEPTKPPVQERQEPTMRAEPEAPAERPGRKEPELRTEPKPDDSDVKQGEKEPAIEGQGTLYGGIPLAPVAKGIAKAFGLSHPAARAYLGNVSRFWSSMAQAAKGARGPGGHPARNLAALMFDTSSGHIRSVLKGYKSPTASAVVDEFHAPSGESGRAIGQTHGDAVDQMQTKYTRQLSEALGDLAENEPAKKQVAALIRNPSNIRKGTKIHDAAAKGRILLDDMYTYLRKAGVDVGEVKEGYYPREFDDVQVLKNPAGFIRALEQAYREIGQKPADAAAAARTLADHVLHGGFDTIFAPDRGNIRAPFVKGRVFGKGVDDPSHPLYQYLLSDPSMNLQMYINRATRRAEIARRFGDGFSEWSKLSKKIIDEGGAGALEQLKDYISIAAGLRRQGATFGLRGASWLRTWATLGLLEKATLSSLQEFVTPAVRSGNWIDSARGLRYTLASMVKTAKGKELRAIAEDMNLIADGISDSVQAARFSGGDIVGMMQSKLLTKYFQRTGLEALTRNQIAGASVGVGRVFIRRMAKRALAKERLAREALVEMGIPDANIDAFATSLLGVRDGLPIAGEIKDVWGDQYRTAIRRFSAQSIMRPHATDRPKWANNPFGSVVFQLQSYNYAFWENVLKRSARMAVKGLNPKEDYLMAERLRLLMPMATLPLLYAVGGLVGEARDAVLGDPNRRKLETTAQKVIKAQSRSVPIAPIDPVVNLISQARYSSGSANILAGPALGTAGRGIDAALAAALHNSDNTNTQERKAWKTVYDLVLEPGANFALAGAHFGLPSTLAAAAATQAVGAGATREAFVGGLGGKAKVKPVKSKTAGKPRL